MVGQRHLFGELEYRQFSASVNSSGVGAAIASSCCLTETGLSRTRHVLLVAGSATVNLADRRSRRQLLVSLVDAATEEYVAVEVAITKSSNSGACAKTSTNVGSPVRSLSVCQTCLQFIAGMSSGLVFVVSGVALMA